MMDLPEMYADGSKQTTKRTRNNVGGVLLIDADFLKYYVIKNIFDDLKKGISPHNKYGEDYVSHYLNVRIDEMIVSRIDAKAYVFLFSAKSKKTFRYAVGFEKEYKGNRTASETYGYVTDFSDHFKDMAKVPRLCGEMYTTFWKDNLEADDLAGVLQNEHTCIYSQDKDLRQIPGKHYDITSNQIIEVSKADALLFLSYQLLAGDTTDNISGFPGMGKTKTQKFLTEVPDVKQLPVAILKHYQKNFGIFQGTDMFVEAWNLVKLRDARGAYFCNELKTELETIKHLIHGEIIEE